MFNIRKAKGVDINLPYYNNKELKLYKKYNIIYSEEVFHAIHFDKELYNLVIYNPNNYTKVIKYIINNKYKSINLDFNHLNKDIINILLEHNYNMPYIFNRSKINLPVINLLYNPTIKKIDITTIDYMFKEYNKNTDVCEGWATLNNNTLQQLKNIVFNEENKGEMSGKLEISQTFDEIDKIVFEVSHTILNSGDNKEVKSVESMYNFHTHPKQAYYSCNTNLGWPSSDDFVIFVMGFIMDEISTYFHCICAIEGIYILTIPKKSISKLMSLKRKQYNKLDSDIEKYISKYIDIDKTNYDYKKGKILKREGKEYNINSVDAYINYVEDAPLFKIDDISIKLFDIAHYSWTGELGLLKGNRKYFKFYYPKVEGNCIINEEHKRN
jgi:hypothetical protein